MTRFEKSFIKSCSSRLVVFSENFFHQDWNDFRLWKLAQKYANAPFLTARLQFLVQDIKISLEYIDSYTKESLILVTQVRILATQLTLLNTENLTEHLMSKYLEPWAISILKTKCLFTKNLKPTPYREPPYPKT